MRQEATPGQYATATVPPLRCRLLPQPVGNDHSQAVQRIPQRLPNALQTIQFANGGQHMGRVDALLSSFLDQPTLSQTIE